MYKKNKRDDRIHSSHVAHCSVKLIEVISTTVHVWGRERSGASTSERPLRKENVSNLFLYARQLPYMFIFE
jgi:hypothetical protein